MEDSTCAEKLVTAYLCPSSEAHLIVEERRLWKANDEVQLCYPMSAKVEQGRETPYPQIPYFTRPDDHVGRKLGRETGIDSPYACVRYGPLLFALPIPDENPNKEKWGARYQYALDVSPVNEEAEITVVRHPMPST